MTETAGNFSSEQIVRGLYRALLGREADPVGLAAHAALLDAGNGVEHVGSSLMHSTEFRDRLPILQRMFD